MLLTALLDLGKVIGGLKMNIQEFQAKLAEADVETTRIAMRIDELVAQLQAGGMSAADEQLAFDELSAHAARLKGVGVVTP